MRAARRLAVLQVLELAKQAQADSVLQELREQLYERDHKPQFIAKLRHDIVLRQARTQVRLEIPAWTRRHVQEVYGEVWIDQLGVPSRVEIGGKNIVITWEV